MTMTSTLKTTIRIESVDAARASYGACASCQAATTHVWQVVKQVPLHPVMPVQSWGCCSRACARRFAAKLRVQMEQKRLRVPSAIQRYWSEALQQWVTIPANEQVN